MHGLLEVLLTLAFVLTAAAAFALWRWHLPKRGLLVLLLFLWPVLASLALLGREFGESPQRMMPLALVVTVSAAALGVLLASRMRKHL